MSKSILQHIQNSFTLKYLFIQCKIEWPVHHRTHGAQYLPLCVRVVYLLLFFIEVNLERVSTIREISQMRWPIRGRENTLQFDKVK